MASMKDPLSSRQVQIVGQKSSAHPRRLRHWSICPHCRPRPNASRCAFCSIPLSPRRREITVNPPTDSSSWGRRGGTLKHLSGLIPKGKSQLTKYERRHHSPGRRFHEKHGRHAMPRGRLSESSRPPRPAQRITHHSCALVLPWPTNPSLLPKRGPPLLLTWVSLFLVSLFLRPGV
jgi:hypothetical protein